MNIGFLASGRGSNFRSVVEACQRGVLDATPAVLISNNSSSGALEFARENQIPAFHLSSVTHPEDLDEAILGVFAEHQVDLIVLAGYMKKLGEKTLGAYQGRILNIHPALLPKFGGHGMYGMNVHRAVIDAKETETGITVHLVDGEYDHGAVLAQAIVPVLEGDTAEDLAARVLVRENAFLVEVIGDLLEGNLLK